jgi:gas vesicle protein
MKDRDNYDVWTAVAIGAVVGIGTALIMRARQEDDTHEIIRRLRPVQRRAQKAVKKVRREVGRHAEAAGDAGEELVSAGRDVLDELRKGAAEIVQDTRRELERAARDSVSSARKAARTAARRVAR